jgi:hypothetical protein
LLSALHRDKGVIDRNLAEHRRVLRAARDVGCAPALLPEMSLTAWPILWSTPERLVPLEHPAVGEPCRRDP